MFIVKFSIPILSIKYMNQQMSFDDRVVYDLQPMTHAVDAKHDIELILPKIQTAKCLTKIESVLSEGDSLLEWPQINCHLILSPAFAGEAQSISSPLIHFPPPQVLQPKEVEVDPVQCILRLSKFRTLPTPIKKSLPFTKQNVILVTTPDRTGQLEMTVLKSFSESTLQKSLGPARAISDEKRSHMGIGPSFGRYYWAIERYRSMIIVSYLMIQPLNMKLLLIVRCD